MRVSSEATVRAARFALRRMCLTPNRSCAGVRAVSLADDQQA